jgi:hypothetical protein
MWYGNLRPLAAVYATFLRAVQETIAERRNYKFDFHCVQATCVAETRLGQK